MGSNEIASHARGSETIKYSRKSMKINANQGHTNKWTILQYLTNCVIIISYSLSVVQHYEQYYINKTSEHFTY